MRIVADTSEQRGTLAFLEMWPKWLIVIPLLLQWVLLGIRYRSLTLPSIANPAITSGGLVGEGKMEYFRSMGKHALAATASTGSFLVDSSAAGDAAAICMLDNCLAFPIVAKPDIGWCGFGVRRVESQAGLDEYLAGFPQGERVLLQAYIADEGEAGIFYVRHPGQSRGRLTGLALRYFPRVTGDGHNTVIELVRRNPRLGRLLRDPMHRFGDGGDFIPECGSTMRLATIGSTRVGGLYRDGGALITPQLSAAIDAIAMDMREFYFGRFDVRFHSEEALMRGEGLIILEVNGAGSEAIEAWDPGLTCSAAFARIFRKQALLFEIAAANRRRGYEPIGLRTLARLHLRQQRLLRRYPPSN